MISEPRRLKFNGLQNIKSGEAIAAWNGNEIFVEQKEYRISLFQSLGQDHLKLVLKLLALI